MKKKDFKVEYLNKLMEITCSTIEVKEMFPTVTKLKHALETEYNLGSHEKRHLLFKIAKNESYSLRDHNRIDRKLLVAHYRTLQQLLQ